MMDGGLIGSVVTVVFFITFVGIVFWAWSGHRKKDFDEAANLPFVDDEAHGKSMPPRQ